MLAWVLFVLGTIGFMGGNVFYDSLMVSVAGEEDYDLVSGLGFALGYLGGGLLFAFCVLLTFQPELLGLASAAEAVRLSFLLTAAWWAVFTIPILLFVPEPRTAASGTRRGAVRAGLRQFVDTFHEIRRLRVVMLFLLAYWLYIDGVDTIIRMAVDYGRALGFGAQSLVAALLITQFVGFPAAIAFGRLGQRIGPKNGIYVAIAVYVVVTIWGSRMDAVWEFYAIAVTIGLVQGGIQALSRSMYARLIPKSRSGEFFGFYNMLGKFAAILGPVLVGVVGELSGSPRIGILSLLVFFVLGAAMLYLVDESRGRHAAAELDRDVGRTTT
jgi:UMF1 family MFS transporter